MIIVKSFVIERAVDLITILEEDFPRQCYYFHELFPAFQYDITDRIIKSKNIIVVHKIIYKIK